MPATPVYALRYPAATDPADVPADIHNLASDVEAAIGALAYAQTIVTVSVTATTEAAAQTVVTAPAVVLAATTNIIVEFFAPLVLAGTGSISLYLFENGVSIGLLGAHSVGGKFLPMFVRRIRAPAAGSYTYSVRASVDAGTGNVTGSTGGGGVFVPAYILVTRA